jgi:hypothetical protein
VIIAIVIRQGIDRSIVPKWEPLAVRVDGELDAGVAQLALHIGWAHACLQE